MASPPPPPPPLPGRAVESGDTTDPAAPHHVFVDIPDAEAPVHGPVFEEAAAVAGKATPKEEEEDDSFGCAGKILAAMLCVWFGGYILAFFVALVLVMVRVYGDKSHPIHARVDERQGFEELAAIIYQLEMEEQQERRRERKTRTGGSAPRT